MPIKAETCFGLFADGHIPYVVDRVEGNEFPSLSQMTLSALSRLDDNPAGFFLMVEGGRIDHAGHANNLRRYFMAVWAQMLKIRRPPLHLFPGYPMSMG